jgi:hypothetical protein
LGVGSAERLDGFERGVEFKENIGVFPAKAGELIALHNSGRHPKLIHLLMEDGKLLLRVQQLALDGAFLLIGGEEQSLTCEKQDDARP